MKIHSFSQRINWWWSLWLATVMVSLCSVVSFLGRSWWGFELATHFRVQYLVVLVLCALGFLVKGKIIGVAVASVMAMVNLFTITSLDQSVHAKDTDSSTGSVFRVLVTNVNWNNPSYEHLNRLIESANPDFLVIVELTSKWMKGLEKWKQQYPYQKIHLHPTYGLGIFSRMPFDQGEIQLLGSAELPLIFVRFKEGERSFVLVGAHPHSPVGPWKFRSRNEYLRELGGLITSQDYPVILLGDLNVTPWSPFFQDLLQQADLKDSRLGFGIQATWPVNIPPFWIPIDHCLVTSDVVIHDRQIGPDIGSDHFPILVDFSIPKSRLQLPAGSSPYH